MCCAVPQILVRRSRVGGASGAERIIRRVKDVVGKDTGANAFAAAWRHFRADVDDDQAFDAIGMLRRVLVGIASAHREPDQCKRAKVERLRERGYVFDHTLRRVVRRPFALAVPTLVQRKHVVSVAHRRGKLVPRVRVAGVAVQ